ncbi:unnamed protein product, partial [Staurois parvus]
LLRDTELLLRDTESLLKNTELLLRDTELLLRDTESLLRDTESLLRDTELLLGDTELLRDTESIVTFCFTTTIELKSMSDNTQRSGRGGNVSGASRRGSRGRGRGSTSRSQRPVLPLSSSGRVSTDNPAVIDWLTRSSSSSQVTSDTYSQRSVGTSDTTVTWHGPGASPLKSRVLYLPLSFGVPSPSEVSHAVGSAPLYSEDELTEGGQERGETSASSAARRRSTGEESGSVAGLETSLSPDP